MSERIGVYRVEGRLGRGGMGEVLLAWDDRLERRVAIKRIRQDAGLSPEQRERFRREARLAARLSHSAVVQIHDLVTEGPDDAIVMEYVEGETLAERLKSGPLALDVALRLGCEIAEGLAAAHDAGLIHRDLKAANVIVTRSGRAKILDFGLARPVDRQPDDEPLTRQGMVIGTFHAMSPEQARGEDLDARSDLFSLGVLLYEMLTGRAPFRGKDPIDTLRRVVHEPPADPRALRPDLPAEVVDLLDRLLAKNRDDRPAGAGEVVTILEGLRPVSGSSAPLLSPDTVSDMPTAPARAVRTAPVLGPAGASAPSVSTILPRTRRWLLLAIPLFGLLLVFVLQSREPEGPSILVDTPKPVPTGDTARALAEPPIRVYMHVLKKNPVAKDEPLDFAVSALQTAGWGVLSSLEGISAIDPTFVRDPSGSLQEIALETAAKEILIVELEKKQGMSDVWLRRVQVADAAVLGASHFTVSLAPDERSYLARAVAVNLPKIYPGHDLRPGTPELNVREEDFATFVKVKRDLDDGKLQLASVLSQLEKVVQGSPNFLEARLLAAQVAISLFQSTRNLDFLSTAQTHIREAQVLAPNDPRTIIVSIRAARTENNLEEAETSLKRLDQLLPGDPEVLVQKAFLLESQGRLDEAVAGLRTAVERAPSWQNLLWLAQREAQTGNMEDARHRFDEIFRQKPDNPWAREALANIEMSYGDLREAEKIYTELARGETPRFSLFNNLGLVYTLQGQASRAADAYQNALDISPENALALINLADAKLDLGLRAEAEALYQRALQKISAQESATNLPPEQALLKAQCLARLKRGPEAVDLAQQALRENPNDAKTHLQAALVFSLTGDRNSALNSAQEAISRGMTDRWFSLSAFDPVRAELQPLLNAVDKS